MPGYIIQYWDDTEKKYKEVMTDQPLPVTLVDSTTGSPSGTVAPSEERTDTFTSDDLTNHQGKGGHFVLDVTATSESPSITLKIQGKDNVSGQYYDIIASSAVTEVGTTVLKIHPGLTTTANSVANDLIPSTWRIVVEHSNEDPIEYSVGYSIV